MLVIVTRLSIMPTMAITEASSAASRPGRTHGLAWRRAARAAPLSIVVSTADREVRVIRAGKEIGAAPVTFTSDVPGPVAFQRQADGRGCGFSCRTAACRRTGAGPGRDPSRPRLPSARAGSSRTWFDGRGDTRSASSRSFRSPPRSCARIGEPATSVHLRMGAIGAMPRVAGYSRVDQPCTRPSKHSARKRRQVRPHRRGCRFSSTDTGARRTIFPWGRSTFSIIRSCANRWSVSTSSRVYSAIGVRRPG